MLTVMDGFWFGLGLGISYNIYKLIAALVLAIDAYIDRKYFWQRTQKFPS